MLHAFTVNCLIVSFGLVWVFLINVPCFLVIFILHLASFVLFSLFHSFYMFDSLPILYILLIIAGMRTLSMDNKFLCSCVV